MSLYNCSISSNKNYSYVFQHSYLYSNLNKETYDKFQKPCARVRYILFVTETKIQQQKNEALLLLFYAHNSNLVRLERWVTSCCQTLFIRSKYDASQNKHSESILTPHPYPPSLDPRMYCKSNTGPLPAHPILKGMLFYMLNRFRKKNHWEMFFKDDAD